MWSEYWLRWFCDGTLVRSRRFVQPEPNVKTYQMLQDVWFMAWLPAAPGTTAQGFDGNAFELMHKEVVVTRFCWDNLDSNQCVYSNQFKLVFMSHAIPDGRRMLHCPTLTIVE